MGVEGAVLLLALLVSPGHGRGNHYSQTVTHDHGARAGCAASRCAQVKPVGMESGKVKDKQLFACSEFGPEFGPRRGRLNMQRNMPKHGVGGWKALTNDDQQWIEVDLLYDRLILGIVTQGRQDLGRRGGEWVTSYTIQYKKNLSPVYLYYSTDGGPKVFPGNFDKNTPVKNLLPEPLEARWIRINPRTWNNHISMRFELLECGGYCARLEPVGMEAQIIRTNQYKASSIYNARKRPGLAFYGYLNNPDGAWSPHTIHNGHYIEIDLGKDKLIGGIVTQGRPGKGFLTEEWVTSYNIQYRNNSCNAVDYLRDNKGNPQIFGGNFDKVTAVRHIFAQPFRARYVRVRPRSWHNYISLRMELLECAGGLIGP
ncbi:lactadherin-like isoform X1 [Branchiostoma floridae x Branchiostoma japonicum]